MPKRVTDIMGEISAASVEQSAGVAQVGQAITQMDQATQQNAALVEESAAAAESLKIQAQQLVQTVAVFKLASANVSQAAAHIGALPPVAMVELSRNNLERRGTDWAKNMARPTAGKVKAIATMNAVHKPSKVSSGAGVAVAATDDWASF